MSITITGGISFSGGVGIVEPPSASDGWFTGGTFGTTLVNRITFATGTTSSRGPLAFVQARASGTGNANYGWFGGGSNPGPGAATRSVNLITYATDTATAVSTGQLYQSVMAPAAAGTSSYGWFGGGKSPAGSPGTGVTTVSKIDYAVTTATATLRGPLSRGRWFLSATSDNTTYGWYIGGEVNSPSLAVVSIIDRITYATDTATASIRGPLSGTKYGNASIGNATYGWVGGGADVNQTTIYSTVERITYATDTATASTRGPLNLKRWALSAVGNLYYGWFGGGYYGPGANTVSLIARIDYSNDTVAATVVGNLTTSNQEMASSSNTP
jgi:hypothetical protein